MSNVVTLHGDKRWKAVIDYRADCGSTSVEYYFEEISELHNLIEHGPDWNFLIRCTLTLNRPDNGDAQSSSAKVEREVRTSAE
ncbi:hypothetical protein MIC97_08680 [Aquamicrobium sp. NLF2-7]|uniref:hypothetical protein n=1 Tax=Aquamicrobium sp. NLF2-7 TaxID=2918753 RepID=UPI001EFB78EA|nr:hypothetical protein [Aquamicrobium sp. NLF2-7]MCG8271576.1 hypothetical protein [Aquamicrobium sp. NLF2-7]